MVHLAHRIEDAFVLVGVEPGDRRLLGLERSATGANEHRFGLDRLVVVGPDTKQRPLSRPDDFHSFNHLAEVKLGPERMDLLHQVVDELLSRDHRKPRNVVNRLLGIEFRALAARLRQDVDQMTSDVEKAEFEHGKQPDRPGADDGDVGRQHFVHAGSFASYPCLAGVVTARPSSASLTLIWQESLELGRTSKAKSSMSSSICDALPTTGIHSSAT